MKIGTETEVGFATDWSIPVWSALSLRQFPPPATFDCLDVNDLSREAVDACVETPCFHADVFVAGDLCKRYTDSQGLLRRGVTLRSLKIISWTQHLSYKNGDISLSRNGKLAKCVGRLWCRLVAD